MPPQDLFLHRRFFGFKHAVATHFRTQKPPKHVVSIAACSDLLCKSAFILYAPLFPFLLFLNVLVGHIPLFGVAALPRWRVMPARNSPGRVRRPNNSCAGADRARVRMTRCVFADYAALNIKLLAAHPSMIDLPCLDVAFHIALTMWTLVNKAFFLNNAVRHRKLAPTNCSMVYSPCFHVTGHIPLVNRANVIIRFLLHDPVLHIKLASTNCSMVYLPQSQQPPQRPRRGGRVGDQKRWQTEKICRAPNMGVGGTRALAHSIVWSYLI